MQGKEQDSNSAAKKRLWSGRSSGEVQDIVIEMGESISLDIELYREDLFGSAHHARMLHKIGILNEEELQSILHALRMIRQEIESGTFSINHELEDIHTHVESRLIELVGATGKKLHTARSRNDQIALDEHLFIRRISGLLMHEMIGLCTSLYTRARENVDTILPGYTHLQAAQPIRLSHHLLAHFWFFIADIERVGLARDSSLRLPLGSGALAGVNYPSDREFLRMEMGFRDIYQNSMMAVSGRDTVAEFLFACSLFALHASRIAEEIVIWNSVEFGFITLPDSLTTGSSIMPQKKNPDFAELARGKTGRLIANLNNLLINLKGLPLSYNRDLQEDRFVLLDSPRQTLMIVRALSAMIKDMVFHPDRMKLSLDRGFTQATDLADALTVERGIGFRDAHHLVGALVGVCVREGRFLSDVPLAMRAEIHEAFADDDFYFRATDLASSVDKKVSYGGVSSANQKIQLKEAGDTLMQLQKNLSPIETYEF